MQLPNLIAGKILKRHKRFLTDVLLNNGTHVTAHTPNTGSMRSCLSPGMTGHLSEHLNKKRKLPFTLELTQGINSLIGVNTSLTNKLAREALEKGIISELKDYPLIKSEYTIGKSRIDFFLKDTQGRPCLLEVKNVSLRENDGIAYFPDSVSTRGQKHLEELMQFIKQGGDAAILFVIQREDVQAFSPAFHIDLKYSELLKAAGKAGVKILPYACRVSLQEICIERKLPLIFNSQFTLQ